MADARWALWSGFQFPSVACSICFNCAFQAFPALTQVIAHRGSGHLRVSTQNRTGNVLCSLLMRRGLRARASIPAGAGGNLGLEAANRSCKKVPEPKQGTQLHSKYPPAEPGALRCEPLKAA